MASWDFEIPFSQYTELEREYGDQAQVDFYPFVTALETEKEDKIRLKAGLSGQYMVYDTPDITVAEDAYSPFREVTLQNESIEIPAMRPQMPQTIRLEQTAPFGSTRCVDSDLFMGSPRMQPGNTAELGGTFQILYYDAEGQLQSGNVHCQQDLEGADLPAILWGTPKGRPQSVPGVDSTGLKGEVNLYQVSADREAVLMLSGLTVGDQTEKDPSRPSLILRRPGQQDLWSLAKENGSTEEAIRQANHLQGDPEPDRMLLIPVL